MSSQKQAMSETTLLLGGSRPGDLSSRSVSKERSRFSPETLLIPVALATRLATLIPSTTVIELIRQVVCRLWNVSHGDPTILPPGGSIPPELCDAPEIARYFVTATAALDATEAIMSMVGCGILSRISSDHGRKPAFLLVLIIGIIGSCFIAGSQYMPDWLADWAFLVGMLFQVFSGPLIYAYLVNMCIVDVCVPEDRTAALSKIAGWAMLGNCISFALGGTITAKTGTPFIVFYVAAAILVATLIYVISVLPESFPQEKRNALSRMHSDSSIDGLPTTTRLVPLIILEPLKMFIPTRKLDGTRNWRLAWCGVHTFVFTVANSYASTAWLVLATSVYHLTPADTGLFLTIVTVSGSITLTVIVPQLVRFLRPYYRRKIIHFHVAEEEMANREESKSETSDHLDVHMAFVSCVITAIFTLVVAASTTNRALILSGICIGFIYVHTPTIRSLVAGSVDPLKQGEAFAAIEMVSNAGSCLSPIIMGSIFTATIDGAPLLLFYVHLVVVLMSSTLLFLVRDADRYQKPREA